MKFFEKIIKNREALLLFRFIKSDISELEILLIYDFYAIYIFLQTKP